MLPSFHSFVCRRFARSCANLFFLSSLNESFDNAFVVVCFAGISFFNLSTNNVRFGGILIPVGRSVKCAVVNELIVLESQL